MKTVNRHQGPLVVGMAFLLALQACLDREEDVDFREHPFEFRAFACADPEEGVVCGEVSVPEDWEAGGRQTSIGVTIFEAKDEEASAAPLFYLVGGPGSGTRFIESVFRGQVPFEIAEVAPRILRQRDVVLVDHRGAGRSGSLNCPGLDTFTRIEDTFPLDRVVECRDRLLETADLTQYHVLNAARDLDAVRAALGHDVIDVIGESYGTSWALAFLREFPARARRLVLAGTLPLDNAVPLEHAANAEQVLRLIFAECARDSSCSSAFPNLEARWNDLLTRLDVSPVDTTVADSQGTPGFTVYRGHLVETLRAELSLYVWQRRVPFIVDRAARGDFGPLLERATGRSFASSDFAMGLYLSAQCPATLRVTPSDIESRTAQTALGDHRIRAQLEACRVWPRAQLPDDWLEPVISDVPTLLITGDLDHETPATWAEDVAGGLSRSLSVVVPNLGHGHSDAQQNCYWTVVEQFLDDPAPEQLDVSCLAENGSIPFFVPDDVEEDLSM